MFILTGKFIQGKKKKDKESKAWILLNQTRNIKQMARDSFETEIL